MAAEADIIILSMLEAFSATQQEIYPLIYSVKSAFHSETFIYANFIWTLQAFIRFLPMATCTI